MKAYTKRKKLSMVMLCIVLVTVMLAVTAYVGINVIRDGFSWFQDYKTSQLIHHGAVPSGYVKCEEYYEDGFMDYTDYCKYYYTEKEDGIFAEDDRYKKIKKSDIKRVKGYFDHCGSMMGNQDRSVDFDFDSKCISTDDYVYIDTREGETHVDTLVYDKYDDYSVYLYDRENHILYYVHNNN